MPTSQFISDQQTHAKPAAKTTHGKAVAASILGNTLEVFDFVSFAFFTVFIGKAFFPTFSSFGQLMLSIATFGAGFVTRPLGAIIIGAYADRAGRKAALTLTIGLMAVSTALVGLTPGYQMIGAAAPIMVLVARLLQGFSTGGELGAATTYLIEMAPANRRGFYASWQFASQGLGLVIAGACGYLLSLVLTRTQIESWGWRVPFLFGVLIAPVGFYIRRQLDDTLEQSEAHAHIGGVFRELLRDHRREVAWSFLAIVGPTVSFYLVSSYMTTYAITVLKLSTSTAMLTGLLAGVVTVVGSLAGGRLSDRLGRRRTGLVAQVVFLALIFPAFHLLPASHSAVALFAVVTTLTLVRMIISSVALGLVTETFPKRIRTTGLSVSYNLAATIFGGTAQLVVAWMINATGDPTSPAWYLFAVNLLTLVGLLKLKTREIPDSVSV